MHYIYRTHWQVMISMIMTMTPFLATTIPMRTNTVRDVLGRWPPIEMVNVEWEQRMELKLEVCMEHITDKQCKFSNAWCTFILYTVLIYVLNYVYSILIILLHSKFM